MLTDADLRELLSYKANGPVLSVYLNTDQVEGSAEVHKLHLRSLLKDVDLPDDVFAITRYFDHEHDWTGRSVAVFSCAEDEYFRSYTLAVPVRNRARAMSQPYVKPLADLLDSYGGYGVVLVDKQGARLFSFHLGELNEQDGMVGENIRRTKRGGGSSAGRRGGVAGQTDYVDELADRNMKEAVEFATQFFAEHNVRRVLIGGTEDNIALFKTQLPKAWQSLVVGTFQMSMIAPENDILDRALQIGAAAEQRREARLVEALVTSAAKGRGGVVNLDDTLSAVRAGRVQTLLIRDGFRAPGARCQGCGYITAQNLDACPFCSGKFETIPDAVEEAVRQVMQSGGDVEVLHQMPDTSFENIGALLRY